MLMSKSRLEKFLYALYSLDSSDLPKPLSRIEELYSCLVTGDEVPTFEPLSRVEKYLMAILGGYDVDSLPNPLSRVEVLLYKLATGDDNLDDVKSFLSEHEELLAEIIRNGGVGGNIDIEYVLYTLSTEFNTLYNTAEKPVKSAILKGQTLVNIFDVTLPSEIRNNHDITISYQVGANETYTFIVEAESTSEKYQGGFITANGLGNGWNGSINNGFSKFTVTTSEATNKVRFSAHGTSNTVQIKKCMIIKGDYINQDIPFFIGMQSVKMPVLKTTGKNLFDISYYGDVNNLKNTVDPYVYYKKLLKLEPNTRYRILSDSCVVPPRMWSVLGIDDKNSNRLTTVYNHKSWELETEKDYGAINNVFTTPSDGLVGFVCYSRYRDPNTLLQSFDNAAMFTSVMDNIRLVKDGEDTTYEPYKSNILTVDGEYGSVGGIEDIVDLTTGKATIKTRQTTVTSENVKYNWSNDTHTCFYISQNDMIKGYGKTVKSNLFPSGGINEVGSKELVTSDGAKNIMFSILNTRFSSTDLTGVIKFLEANELNVRYLLATESIKTVDLSVVDQDGNDTELSTFNDITHVTLSSEGLIPEAELEVATKNEEVLNTMSLEMDDISKTQNGLQETLDTQSENVDSTMIATTEIYEGLL